MTNSEWLRSLEPSELKAWFESEHKDSDIELARKLGDNMAKLDQQREIIGKMMDAAHEIERLGTLYG